MPLTVTTLLLFMSGAVFGGIVGFRARFTSLSRETAQAHDPQIAADTVAVPDSPTYTTLHNLRTPINMILGYCDVLLNSAGTHSRSLSMLTREDVSSIARNARQLQILIDQQFASTLLPDQPIMEMPAISHPPAPEVAAASPEGTILVFHTDPSFGEWLQRQMAPVTVLQARTIAEVGHLPLNQTPVALVITDFNEPAIPELVTVLGDHVPIVGCVLPGTRRAAEVTGSVHYLPKPVTFQALTILFASFATPIRNILIIDDHQDNVEMTSRILIDINADFQIWKAYTGREGLALLREQPPDAVLIDVRLPDIDGTTIARYLRTQPLLDSIPIILVSARRDSDLPPFPMPIQLSLIQLGGFSPTGLLHLFSALMNR